MAKKFILGNWKMHGLQAQAASLAMQVGAHTAPDNAEVVLFPPFTALAKVAEQLHGSAIRLGAQDCSPEPSGAFTGDISAEMLKDAGCSYIILGHSERRSIHGETDILVRQKAAAALKAGLVAVICVGENLEERESGKHLQVIEKQVKNSLPALSGAATFIIAYEPVWAIGSGKIPTLAQIEEVHKTIASLLTYATSDTQMAGTRPPIVYGGSVKAANACELLASGLVDGVLVGGASLNAVEFGKIIDQVSGFGMEESKFFS